MHVQRKLISIVAVVGALLLVGAAQASAASWSGSGSMFQGTTSGTGTKPAWKVAGFDNSCEYGTIDLKIAAGVGSATMGGVKFGNQPGALGDCTGYKTTSVSTSGTWKFQPNSTTSVTVTIPAGGLQVSKWSDPTHLYKLCDFTVNAATNVPATWSNATRRLTLNPTTLPATRTTFVAEGECWQTSNIALKEFSYQFPAPLLIF